MSPVLRASGIGISFGATRVLTSAGLWVGEGTVTALMGRNGAGKTTLLRVAAGLLRPDQGTVVFRDEAVLSPKLSVMGRRGLFYLPERGLLAAPVPLGRQIEAVASRYGGRDSDTAVDRFRLAGLLDHRPRALSGGERRRAELALAWVRRPVCLLADEPFRGIAPRDRALVAETLVELAEDGCGVSATGHEVEDLLEVADEVIWMRSGTTRGLGRPAEAVEDPAFVRGYLGGRPDGPAGREGPGRGRG